MRQPAVLTIVPTLLTALAVTACSSPDATTQAPEAVATGLSLGAEGTLVLAPEAVGKPFLLSATLFRPVWNAEQCGPPPANLALPATPAEFGAVPDVCKIQSAPLVSHVVSISVAGGDVVLTSEGQEWGRFPRIAGPGIRFRLNPTKVEFKPAIFTAMTNFPTLPLTDAQVSVSKEPDGFFLVQQDGFAATGANKVAVRIKYGIKRWDEQAPPPHTQQAGARYFYETNSPERSAARFDMRDGRVVHWELVNVPAEWKPAAHDAIKYWNRVFKAASGNDRVFFDLAEASRTTTTFEPGHNLISWVANNDASASSGFSNLHPQTGEILYSNVLIGSGFPCGAEKMGAAVQALLHGGSNTGKSTSRFRLDFMTYIFAHEIGHALGMQHNFHGSEGKNVSHVSLERLFEVYEAGESSAATVTSSLMEYLPLPLNAVVGGQVNNGALLPHDVFAVAHAYFGRNDGEPQPFCNDDDQKDDPTCVQFDHPMCTAAEPGPYCFANFTPSLRCD